MSVTNTDAVLWYDVGIFGELAYAVPNWSNDPGSLNPGILDYVDVTGRNLFNIMHHEDVDLNVPPSINTLRRIHRLYLRASQILSARAVPPGQSNMETKHVQPGGEFFRVYPIPYFRVRNNWLRRWAGLILMSLAEAMQHTENRKTIEFSTTFAGQVGQYLTRVYYQVATEMFNVPPEAAKAPGFTLTDEHLTGYNPAEYFTSTELVDTVPDLSHVFTEDSLEVLSRGIYTCDLPKLQPYPKNLTNYYAELRDSLADPAEHDAGGGGGGGAASIIPPPPAP